MAAYNLSFVAMLVATFHTYVCLRLLHLRLYVVEVTYIYCLPKLPSITLG